MYGAILGDMIGAPYEFDRGKKTKDFELFGPGVEFTDDSVMTVAVADALLSVPEDADDETVKAALVQSMQAWGRRYPDAGYGLRFLRWLRLEKPHPYGSWGNGSAMRVSAAGWLYGSLEETRRAARLTAEVTHNHPEGIKGAEATASAIFLARTGVPKEGIREYIVRAFGYDLSRTCNEIRPGYHHVESCQETVPEAVTAFLEGNDFEDVIRTAVSLGGDCDTLTCIAGSMAEAFYGVPDDMKAECRKRVTAEMRAVLDRFDERLRVIHTAPDREEGNAGNKSVEDAIARFRMDENEDNLSAVLEAIRQRMHEDGPFLFPVVLDEAGAVCLRTIQTNDGELWRVAFTSKEESENGPASRMITWSIDRILREMKGTHTAGFIINPWGQPFSLTKAMIARILKADEPYTIPDDRITEELLADGAFLKRAVGIYNRNKTDLNLEKLSELLRKSLVWVPCRAVFGREDREMLDRTVAEAVEKGDTDSLEGFTFTTQDTVRLVPDILHFGKASFFPAFTSAEEMGEYGMRVSKVQRPFLEVMGLARSHQKDVAGIAINPFTEPFAVPWAMVDMISGMDADNEEEE
ncbi:MAG: ADP-ribosylglycohydrolase family protein [Lachnospiraceae bacterium]|nr:ADP-ribosylglycohydrolase family protein [Lachnospiraceae bacterium]